MHDNNVKGDKRNVRSPTTIKKVEEKPPVSCFHEKIFFKIFLFIYFCK